MQDPDDLYDGAQEEYVGDQIMCLVDVRAPMVNNYAEGQGSHQRLLEAYHRNNEIQDHSWR